MSDSRPTSPEAPPQDLWSSILDSVSSSRSIPAKQVLVLGEPSSGKSTLTAALLNKKLDVPEEESEDRQRSDFALGYDWADVRDEADEDTLARLSVYTVPSSAATYTALLPHFLPPRTALPHTVVIIVLDWTKPWTFIDELYTWLNWIEIWVKSDESREAQIVREENRERLQSHLQHYSEPSAEPIPATSTLSSTTLLPLGPGTLTHNTAGVPIIVACTKADLIDDGNDVIGADGAALFYTTPMPQTLQILRQYALHLLFAPPAPSPGLSTEGAAPVKNLFPFQQKPNTLDRDRIVVPAGWDSWNKITVLREGFEAKTWGEAWERELERSEGEQEGEPGAKAMYSALVPDQGVKPPPLPPFNSPMAEQTFLAKNYDENSKKPDRDPRGAFKNPVETTAAGVVGPMGSSSFNLPNVERALTEMESGVGGPAALNMSVSGETARKLTSRGTGRSSTSSLSVPTVAGGAVRTQGASPTLPPSPSPTGQTQHEVLQNFFASLLSTSKPSSTTAAKAASKTSTPEKASAAEEGS
ncbi:hypothetical protein NM688_g4453 [Phlebia brevispora]|uniref:Uncharacterized protein n=1 Tax=Phlebia brevispora TaxID=194682 RepID=A0ACC1T2W5_9APHY|nr:hypothetical protein NM688_g4453 [Phlebia brevispora]